MDALSVCSSFSGFCFSVPCDVENLPPATLSKLSIKSLRLLLDESISVLF